MWNRKGTSQRVAKHWSGLNFRFPTYIQKFVKKKKSARNQVHQDKEGGGRWLRVGVKTWLRGVWEDEAVTVSAGIEAWPPSHGVSEVVELGREGGFFGKRASEGQLMACRKQQSPAEGAIR